METLRTVPCSVKDVTMLSSVFPTVVCVLTRSCNANVVVYEANITPSGRLDRKDPISVYWLDLDPELRARRRAKGILHDYEKLSFLERTMAYGVQCEMLGTNRVLVKFKVPNLTCVVRYDPATRTACAYSGKKKIRSTHVVVNRNLSLQRKLRRVTVFFADKTKKCVFNVSKKN